ncbi:hypothetical protein JKP88DRAFT_265637 [Tribonema minus]|uniref:Uncharacterized protein n=1 Tax=Tribonema minus TaxID=303371 RepID=A0A835YIN7_9STRA|nr:hypothetical protein JKP88DRAFT_265637 [Tribonema minus]
MRLVCITGACSLCERYGRLQDRKVLKCICTAFYRQPLLEEEEQCRVWQGNAEHLAISQLAITSEPSTVHRSLAREEDAAVNDTAAVESVTAEQDEGSSAIVAESGVCRDTGGRTGDDKESQTRAFETVFVAGDTVHSSLAHKEDAAVNDTAAVESHTAGQDEGPSAIVADAAVIDTAAVESVTTGQDEGPPAIVAESGRVLPASYPLAARAQTSGAPRSDASAPTGDPAGTNTCPPAWTAYGGDIPTPHEITSASGAAMPSSNLGIPAATTTVSAINVIQEPEMHVSGHAGSSGVHATRGVKIDNATWILLVTKLAEVQLLWHKLSAQQLVDVPEPSIDSRVDATEPDDTVASTGSSTNGALSSASLALGALFSILVISTAIVVYHLRRRGIAGPANMASWQHRPAPPAVGQQLEAPLEQPLAHAAPVDQGVQVLFEPFDDSARRAAVSSRWILLTGRMWRTLAVAITELDRLPPTEFRLLSDPLLHQVLVVVEQTQIEMESPLVYRDKEYLNPWFREELKALQRKVQLLYLLLIVHRLGHAALPPNIFGCTCQMKSRCTAHNALNTHECCLDNNIRHVRLIEPFAVDLPRARSLLRHRHVLDHREELRKLEDGLPRSYTAIRKIYWMKAVPDNIYTAAREDLLSTAERLQLMRADGVPPEPADNITRRCRSATIAGRAG